MAITSFNSVGGFSVNDTGINVVDANANVYGNLVSANLFSGDGGGISNIAYANVVGAYGDSNVAEYLSTNTNDLIGGNVSATGSITGSAFYGNGAGLTGLPAGYTDQDVANVLESGNIIDISAAGGVTAEWLAGDGGNITDIPYVNITGAYGDANVTAYLANNTSNVHAGNISVSGNIVSNNQITAHRLFAGSEDEPVDIAFGAVTTRAFISSIGADYGSEMILHRHSTTQPVTLYGVLSNSDTANDSPVTSGQDLFSITAAGWTGNTYQNFSGISFMVDGNVSDSSSPGGITFWTTPHGSNVSANALFLDSEGDIYATGNLNANGFVSVVGNVTGSHLFGNAAAVTGLATVAHSGNYADLSGLPNIPTALSQLTNDANLITWADAAANLPSYSGNLGGTLTTSYQPHITQVGQLSALDIAGGITVAGAMSVGGNTVLGNLFVTGNVDMPGNITVINANSYFSIGDVNGFDAFYAGLAVGFANLAFTVAQFSADNNEYAQINFQNINGGNMATTDYIATADNGTNSTYYIDLGITSSTFDGSSPNTIGNILGPNEGYLYVMGQDPANTGGNLIIGTATEDRNIILMCGGGTTDELVANISLSEAAFVVPVSSEANITANYFIGNGSQLTGIASYGNADLANIGANAVSTTGNISAGYFIGDGSQLTGLPASYGNADVAAYLPTYSGNLSAGIFSSSGNVTANNIVNTRLVVRTPSPNVSALDLGDGTISASMTINCNTTDQSNYSDNFVSLTVNAITGSPFDGQKLTIRLKSTVGATSVTFAASFRAIGATLPSAMTINKYVYIGVIYNAADAVWDVVSVATQA